jgi:hypothetical protein
MVAAFALALAGCGGAGGGPVSPGAGEPVNPGGGPGGDPGGGTTVADRDADGIPDIEDRFPDDPARFDAFTAVLLDGLSGLFSAAVAVNGDGAVVGVSEDGSGAVKGTRWHVGEGGAGGAPAALQPIAGNSHSAAYGISEDGVAVGESERGVSSVAVAWTSPGAPPIELGLGGLAPPAVAHAIEERRVVGEARSTAGEAVAVLWTRLDADAIPLGPLPGDGASAAYAIAEGLVVGASTGPGGRTRGAVWEVEDGRARGLWPLAPLPGHVASVALGVNDRGEIVGESEDAAGGVRAVAWTFDGDRPGSPVDLGEGSASSIDRRGRIAGAHGVSPQAALWDVRNFALPEFVLADLLGPTSAYALNERGLVVGLFGDRAVAAVPLR